MKIKCFFLSDSALHGALTATWLCCKTQWFPIRGHGNKNFSRTESAKKKGTCFWIGNLKKKYNHHVLLKSVQSMVTGHAVFLKIKSMRIKLYCFSNLLSKGEGKLCVKAQCFLILLGSRELLKNQ